MTNKTDTPRKPRATRKPRKSRGPRKDWYQVITDNFVQAIEGVLDGSRPCLPWRKPWKGGRSATGVGGFGDFNPVSGTVYKGINILLLAIARAEHDFDSLEWGTFKQWKKAGGFVAKGSKGTQIVFWKPTLVTVKDDDGNVVLDDKGKPKLRKSFFLRVSSVFNRDQVEGLKEEVVVEVVEEEVEEEEELAQHAVAEAVLDGSGASISWDSPGRAFYRPSSDEIHLPPRQDFTSVEGLYGTALHELVHWTGHHSRVAEVHPRHGDDARTKGGFFGSEDYAAEELVAEFGAAFLCAATGVVAATEVRDDHVSYLRSWLKALKDDKRAIFTATSRAQDACTYLLAKAGIEVPGKVEVEETTQDEEQAA